MRAWEIDAALAAGTSTVISRLAKCSCVVAADCRPQHPDLTHIFMRRADAAAAAGRERAPSAFHAALVIFVDQAHLQAFVRAVRGPFVWSWGAGGYA
jgi:hypothetical protein